MSIPLTDIERLYIKKRLNGKMLTPVRSLPTTVFPTGRGFEVTTAWNELNDRWSLGRHTGQDFACPEGMPVFALTWGRVLFAGEFGGWSSKGDYGLHVVIQEGSKVHDYGVCHLSDILAEAGDFVRPGTLVGLSGRSGNVTGWHTHLEARPAGGGFGSDVDPRLVRKKAAA